MAEKISLRAIDSRWQPDTFNQMVKYHPKPLNLVFAALSDPTRRAILARLATGELRVTELAAPFAMSLAAVSKHLRVLEQAGLLARTRQGREIHIRLVAEPLAAAADWVEQYRKFWSGHLRDIKERAELKARSRRGNSQSSQT